jgi:hypothetical protein
MSDVAVASQVAELNEYVDEKRLSIYKFLTSACAHLYSKGKLQEEKFIQIANVFADLAVHDPIFMAHLAAYSAKQDSKDLKVLAIFFNSLNDANGLPFFQGSTKLKPNYRLASYALLQNLDPSLALRVIKLANKKFGVDGVLNESKHFPTGLKTAFRKYLRYRESNSDWARNIKNSGLSEKVKNIYRLAHLAPSEETARILRWKQKSDKAEGKQVEMEAVVDFEGMTSDEICSYIEEENLSPIVALSTIPANKITAKVAKSLLSCCTGNQSIVLYNWFSKNGFLDVKAINNLFKSKVKQSTTAVDRIDTLTKNASEEDKKDMAQIRSDIRKAKANVSDIGKIFVHIDGSGSMQSAIQYAMDNASLIAECVNEPKSNFAWGVFGSTGRRLKLPDSFTKEDFYSILYGYKASGTTDCIALYGEARRFGADVDVYITDQGHNVGNIHTRISEFHNANPQFSKPRAAIIVDFSNNRNAINRTELQVGLTRSGIPISIIKPEALKESALVAQSVRNALKGELSVVEDILNTPIPELPSWWNKF